MRGEGEEGEGKREEEGEGKREEEGRGGGGLGEGRRGVGRAGLEQKRSENELFLKQTKLS